MNRLNYNPGGLVVPKGYHVPQYPYGEPPAGNSAQLHITVVGLPGGIAAYDGKQFTLRRNEADGSYTSVTFEFWTTGAHPVLPIIEIDVAGFTTAQQIGNEISEALQTAGFRPGPPGLTGTVIVSQPFPGSQGDLGFFLDFTGNTQLAIGAGPYFSPFISPLTQYGDTVWFGGAELTVPLRVGYIFGMAPVTAPIFSNGSIVG